MSKLLILSGEIGSGKTTLLLNLLDYLKTTGALVSGILTPPVITNGEKIGIDLVDLKSGERKLFATLRDKTAGELVTQKWAFKKEVMEWGNHILSQSVPCQVLIIDELGPLELEQERGLLEALAAIRSKNYTVGIVVIRPALVPLAISLLPDAKVITFSRGTEQATLNQLEDEVSVIRGDSPRQ